MRRSSTPAIPPSLYRQFAILTLVLATGLAMFADGDNSQAQAAQADQVRADARPAPPTIAVAAPTAATGSSSGGWDEVDFDSSFGAPTEGSLGDDAANAEVEGDSSPVPSPDNPASLTSMEREVLLRGLQQHNSAQPDN